MRGFVCAAPAGSAVLLLGLDRASPRPGCALPPRTDGGRAWAPTPLLPRNGTVLPSTREAQVELRWTSSGGGAAHYRVELQRGISAQGPFSEVQDADVTGNAGLSVAYTVSPDVLGAAPHQYWRWRVGQTTSAGGPPLCAWPNFSFRSNQQPATDQPSP